MVDDVDAVMTDIFKSVPGTLIMVSGLIVNKNDEIESCGKDFNESLKKRIEVLKASGKIYYVDMHGPDG